MTKSSTTDQQLPLGDYLTMVRRRKWLILALVTVVVAGAAAATLIQTPRYRAEARVAVSASSGLEVLNDDPALNSNARDRNLNNEVGFAQSDRVLNRAAETFGSEVEANITMIPSSDILAFTVVDTDPQAATDIANIFAESYVAERSQASGEQFIAAVDVINDRLTDLSAERLELERSMSTTSDSQGVQIQLDSLASEEARLRGQLNEIDVLSQLTGSSSASVLNEAEVPDDPFAPSWPRNLVLGLIAGLLAGLGVAVLAENLDDTILTKADLEAALDIPVIGVIPEPFRSRLASKNSERLVISENGAFPEAFRSLRSSIELGQAAGTKVGSILVTSASPAEGKSTVASHLAMTLARSNARVLVIDADMHNPTQHKSFRVDNQNGLGEHLLSVSEAEMVTEQATTQGLVKVLPAGVGGTSPADLLRSSKAEELIGKLTDIYDYVIIDSPPLRPVSDTLPLARMADATLLIAMSGSTKAKELDHAMELLERAQVVPFGAVLNNADQAETGYGYGYGYGKK